MADVVSLSTLRLLTRQRADMENSQFITNDEWRRMINRGYAELYDLIVTSANSEDYFLKSGTVSLVSFLSCLYGSEQHGMEHIVGLRFLSCLYGSELQTLQKTA